jgi:hypothetical protein
MCVITQFKYHIVNISVGTVPQLVDVSMLLPFCIGLDILYGMHVYNQRRFAVLNVGVLKRENMAQEE